MQFKKLNVSLVSYQVRVNKIYDLYPLFLKQALLHPLKGHAFVFQAIHQCVEMADYGELMNILPEDIRGNDQNKKPDQIFDPVYEQGFRLKQILNPGYNSYHRGEICIPECDVISGFNMQ
jgi:hypothetical protein